MWPSMTPDAVRIHRVLPVHQPWGRLGERPVPVLGDPLDDPVAVEDVGLEPVPTCQFDFEIQAIFVFHKLIGDEVNHGELSG